MKTKQMQNVSNADNFDKLDQSNRPVRNRRVAQDLLVEYASKYNVGKLYGGRSRKNKGTKRQRSPCDVLPPDATTEPQALVASVHETAKSTQETNEGSCSSTSGAAAAVEGGDMFAGPNESSLPAFSTPLKTRVFSESSATPARASTPVIPQPLVMSRVTPVKPPASVGPRTPCVSSTPVRTMSSSSSALFTVAAAATPSAETQELIDITLLTLSGRQASIRILHSRTLSELIAKMEALLGLPRNQIRLKLGGSEFPLSANTKSLRELGIGNGDTLTIRLESSQDGVAPSASPFRDKLLLGHSPRFAKPSPYKDIPDWMK